MRNRKGISRLRPLVRVSRAHRYRRWLLRKHVLVGAPAGVGPSQVGSGEARGEGRGGAVSRVPARCGFWLGIVLCGVALSGCSSSATAVVAAAKLAFTVQPSTAAGGAAITPAVLVAVQDAQGNTVTTATTSITVASGPTPRAGPSRGPRRSPR
jgi:hypothetical protein